MTRILGYADRISAAPGDSIEVKVSCDGLDFYDASLIRVIQGDINPAGPGYRDELVSLDLGGPFHGRYQPINTGSYAVVDDVPSFDLQNSLGLQALIWPTLPGSGSQTILSRENSVSGAGFRIYLDADGALAFSVTTKENSAVVSTEFPLHSERWYLVSATYDAEEGTLTVVQRIQDPSIKSEHICRASRKIFGDRLVAKIDASVIIAARLASDRPAREHFNGRIEAPRILSRSLLADEMNNPVDRDCQGLTAAWDFSVGISTDQITDVSGNNLHGKLINLPTRGVCGHAWNGDKHCWTDLPEHYGAIHFHDDDLYDCEWETDFEIQLPDDLASGVYAIRLHSEDDEYFIVFAVRPPRGKTTAPVAFLMPIASYMAYANTRMAIDIPETEIVCGRLIELNPIDLFMQKHPELGLCFYDLHSDGSGVFYSSRLRPIVNMQPKHIGCLGGMGSNVWQFNADTHILNFLEQLGQPFDVITDEDLESEGIELLEDYQAIISGTHPEYYAIGMMDSLQSYLDKGGRLMYLGGNGYYWRISYHPTLPGVIECRKSEDGIRAFATRPGEFYASFTGEYTGLWRRNGRAPNQLVGIGMVSQGFDRSSHYVMRESSRDPRVAFIFQGVEGPIIGDFGLSGGGAAGLEVDATDHSLGTPPHTLVLASSEHHTDLYLITPEDMNDPAPGLGGTEAEIIRSEMVFFETPNGGAVFSTGSIAWAGSLSHKDYNNDIARITGNVLDRFLDETPFSPVSEF